MSEGKGLLRSLTVQGAAIAAFPAIDQILISLGVFQEPLLSQASAAIVTAVGAVLAIFGRVKAIKAITGIF